MGIEQLLAHLVGDYVLQNHVMANRKTKSSFWALVHVLFYGLPFLLLVVNPWQWLVIVGTHFVIDRFRLAQYWVDLWGTGKWGKVMAFLDRKAVTRVDDAPPWLGVWLLILVDNTLHLTINFLTLRFLVFA